MHQATAAPVPAGPTATDRFALVADIVHTTAGIDIRAIDPTAALKDFGMDSLSMIDTMMKIEAAIQSEISDAEIARIRNLDDLLKVVDDHVQARGPVPSPAI